MRNISKRRMKGGEVIMQEIQEPEIQELGLAKELVLRGGSTTCMDSRTAYYRICPVTPDPEELER